MPYRYGKKSPNFNKKYKLKENIDIIRESEINNGKLIIGYNEKDEYVEIEYYSDKMIIRRDKILVLIKK